MKKTPAPKLPPGLSVDDMTGGGAEARRMNHSLYRRGLLPAASVKNIRKKLGLELPPEVKSKLAQAPPAGTLSDMAFSVVSNKSQKTYFLHIRESPTASGGTRKLFYFSGDAKDAAPALPEGYTVIENERTGLPFLKKKA